MFLSNWINLPRSAWSLPRCGTIWTHPLYKSRRKIHVVPERWLTMETALLLANMSPRRDVMPRCGTIWIPGPWSWTSPSFKGKQLHNGGHRTHSTDELLPQEPWRDQPRVGHLLWHLFQSRYSKYFSLGLGQGWTRQIRLLWDLFQSRYSKYFSLGLGQGWTRQIRLLWVL